MVKPLVILQGELENAAQETRKAKQKVLTETEVRRQAETETRQPVADIGSVNREIVGQAPRGGVS